jgi:hypothetical protein
MTPKERDSPTRPPEDERLLTVVLEGYRQLEAEKRLVAQALLGVTGLLLAAVAAVAANLKPDNLLPLVVLAPAVLVAGWVGAVLVSACQTASQGGGGFPDSLQTTRTPKPTWARRSEFIRPARCVQIVRGELVAVVASRA